MLGGRPVSKRIQITVSLVFAVATAVLSFSCGRSFFYRDQLLRIFDSQMIGIESASGHVRVAQVAPLAGSGTLPAELARGWSAFSGPFRSDTAPPPMYELIEAGLHCVGVVTYLVVPYWFLVLSSAVLVALPWLNLQFSLRSLLIATTLIAGLLGLLAWPGG
jgi:hypothetical protein